MNQLSDNLNFSKFFFISIFSLLLTTNFLNAQCDAICATAPNGDDFDALKQLYCNTEGDNWYNNDGWNAALNEGGDCDYCEWYGVTCENGRVVQLNLSNDRLVGEIPEEINKLEKIRILILKSNDISGNLPESIGQLSELEELNLSYNDFYTPIPTQIGQLGNLKFFIGNNANFSGAIPDGIGNLSNLEELNLGGNAFTSYPESLGDLTNLKILNCYSCFEAGLPFPTFLGQMLNLEYLRISGAEMTGNFPEDILDLKNLSSLILSENNLTGQLPTKTLQLDSLVDFNISGNELDGEFALDFTNCQKLRSLIIDENNFSGTFPEGFGSISTLDVLRARYNDFEGCLPLDLYDKCGKTIWFNGNSKMSFQGYFDQYCDTDGSLDAQIGSRCDDGIGYFELDFIEEDCSCAGCEHPDGEALLKLYWSTFFSWINKGTKDDPENEDIGWAKDCDICNWYGITCNDDNRVIKIDLSSNGLGHTISMEFQNLPFLEELDLSNNAINSELPKLIDMDNLKSINLSNNQFYKTLPLEWATKSNLETIDVHNNLLTGFIPAGYGDFVQLKYIDFSNNGLNGAIPFNATSNINLEFINLFRNGFTGNLPSELGDIPTLQYLNLSTNLFEGCIPDSYRDLCASGDLNLNFNYALPWQGDINQYCETDNINAQNGAHCGYNAAGYIEDCSCINIISDCDSPHEVLCKPWVQNFAQTLQCQGQNRYSIFTSTYGNIPVIVFSQGQQFATKVISTIYIYTCDGILLENCSFSLGSNCNFAESIYKQIQDDIVQIFHCQDDEFPEDCDNICSHPDMPALMSLYGATKGDNWLENAGWTEGANGTNCDPCDGWFGVECDDNGRVTSVDLPENNLSGNIPSALYNLEELYYLNLGKNLLKGAIYHRIANLTELNTFYLYENMISGSIPLELHQIPNLRAVDLSSNQLSGSIPEFEMELAELIIYKANFNNLISMPNNYSNTPYLEDLGISNNDLTGDLPMELFLLENLLWLDLNNNNLEGTLPADINCVLLNLLSINNNQLTGTIPESLGSLQDLFFLSLSNNQFSGTLPESMKNLTNILDISLAQNQFSGPLPTFIQHLGYSLTIDLSSNNFEGCIDSSFLSLCDDFVDIDISDNPSLENDNWPLFCATQEGICEGNTPPNNKPYNPMSIEGANWIFKVKDEGNTRYYGWRIQGDTIINGTHYKKGFRINVEHVIAPPYQALEYSINLNFPAFFMRDDTIQKKIYAINNELGNEFNCYPLDINQELRIYDFNPNIGEDIYCLDGQNVVSDIDTTEYFGYTLPRYSIDEGNRKQYQQIGDIEGLFRDINSIWVAGYSEELIEYCVRDEIGCPHMLGPLSTNEIVDDPQVLLYPNPANNKITISSNQIISSIEVFSIDGRRIINDRNINSKKVAISLIEESSQVLVALIKLENGDLVRKIFAKN